MVEFKSQTVVVKKHYQLEHLVYYELGLKANIGISM